MSFQWQELMWATQARREKSGIRSNSTLSRKREYPQRKDVVKRRLAADAHEEAEVQLLSADPFPLEDVYASQ
jgi:hypothetical protein